MSYTLPLEALEYVLYQRTSLVEKRSKFTQRLARFGIGKSYERRVREQAQRNKEIISNGYFQELAQVFATIKPHIPNHATSVLDIGCGIAGLDIFLWNHLRDNDPEMYLLDKTKIEEKVWYSFTNSGAFYNSLDSARKVLEVNGVPHDNIHLIEAPSNGNISDLKNIDFVVSTISWGFHYPIDLYVNSVSSLMADGGVLIVDVRKNTDGHQVLKSVFTDAEVIADTEKYSTLKCRKSL